MLNLTPALKLYASWRLRALEQQRDYQVVGKEKRGYAALQEDLLHSLLKKAKATKFGRDHNFSEIRGIADFQQAVPLRRYEDFWEQYWEADFPRLNNCSWPGLIPFYPVSSGTSKGSTKYLPLSHEMNRCITKAGIDLLVYHLRENPKSRLFAGKNFVLGGSTELVEQCPGVFSGDLSGISVATMPWWAGMRCFPPKELALLADWEVKVQRLAEESLAEPISSISGVPSWLLILFRKLSELRPECGGKLDCFYPDLELLVHGGVNFAPYHSQFKKLIEGSQISMREVYPASEGFLAIADRGYNEGLRLNLDHGVFYEFVALKELDHESPARHSLETVELGVNYAVVLSTCAGMWSYIIGDTIVFTDLDPPRILVTGRTSYYMSAFGEHLIAQEVEDAVARAADSLEQQVCDYSMGAIFPACEGELGGHLYILEFEGGLNDRNSLAALSDLIDKHLCERNEDYESHRAQGYGLRAPTIWSVAPGSFAAWMKERGKLGGQNKVPRIISKTELFEHLKQHIRENDRLLCQSP